ncbi:MAG: hypothetical protein OHK0021_07470 [Bryobacter sp.]
MRSLLQFGLFRAALCMCLPTFLPAATLEKLEPSKMIEVATEIVRGKVLYCAGTYRPPVIWTNCEIVVSERLKGSGGARVLISIPGGSASGIRQSYSGAPTLERDKEYLFFLWQGKSGLKQIVGLCQGLLTIVKDDKGNLVAFRNKVDERMVDSSGREVADVAFRQRLDVLRTSIKGRVQ